MKYRLITVCLGLLFASTVLGQIGSKGCNKLERSEDRFENTVRISTPYKLTNLFRVIKVISETDVATYLSIRTGGYTASVGEKGVTLREVNPRRVLEGYDQPLDPDSGHKAVTLPTDEELAILQLDDPWCSQVTKLVEELIQAEIDQEGPDVSDRGFAERPTS